MGCERRLRTKQDSCVGLSQWCLLVGWRTRDKSGVKRRKDSKIEVKGEKPPSKWVGLEVEMEISDNKFNKDVALVIYVGK